MIDYDKLNEHMLEIAKNTDGGIKLSAFMIDQLLGGCQKISEKSLHEGIEFAIAKQKEKLKVCHMLAKSRRILKRVEEN